MTEVLLHIYDVTNSGSDKTNNTIVQINKIFKDGIGLGGIFHSAVQEAILVLPTLENKFVRHSYLVLQHYWGFRVNLSVQLDMLDYADMSDSNISVLNKLGCVGDAGYVFGDDEWSFGFCEQGTGVFSCPSGKNPMYTYRECIVLGKTNFSVFKVNQILRELSREWPGSSYDLLSKNCNHFCDELCERLGVPKLPGWVNRFAHAGDAAVEIAGTTAFRFRQAKTEIVTASKVAYRFLSGITANNSSNVSPESPSNSNRGGSPRFQQPAWFKNLVSAGAKPSSSSDLDEDDDLHQQQQQRRHDSEAPLRQGSLHDN